MIPHVISDSGVITTYAQGRPYTFAKDHKFYQNILTAIQEENYDEIVRLGSVSKVIETYTQNNVEVSNGVVKYKGRELHNSFTERILRHISAGLPFKHLLAFLENLMENSSRHAVNELYNFLVNRNLPITTDGCFLAYKTVDNDYMDWYSHTVDNHIGKVNEMPRNEVDDEWRNACSSGFHVGSLEYLEGFHKGEGHIMVVKVNPKDVVSVPVDECTKCRTCKYEVVDEMSHELAKEVYEAQKGAVVPVTPDTLHTARDEDDEDDEGEFCDSCGEHGDDCCCDDEYEDDEDDDEDDDDGYDEFSQN